MANTAIELLSHLRSAGFEVSASAGGLVVSPRSKLSPAEVERVTAMKVPLLNLVIVERMAECATCGAAVNPAAGAEVGRLCRHGGCPYRRAGR